MVSRQAMRIGPHTYGYYYPEGGEFSCSHGSWSSPCKIIDATRCKLPVLGNDLLDYVFLTEIPDEYDYT